MVSGRSPTPPWINDIATQKSIGQVRAEIKQMMNELREETSDEKVIETLELIRAHQELLQQVALAEKTPLYTCDDLDIEEDPMSGLLKNFGLHDRTVIRLIYDSNMEYLSLLDLRDLFYRYTPIEDKSSALSRAEMLRDRGPFEEHGGVLRFRLSEVQAAAKAAEEEDSDEEEDEELSLE